MDNWDPGSVFVDGKCVSQDTWYDSSTGSRSSRRCTTSSAAPTKLYGAALYRPRPEDFGVLKHADGISPAWPLSYDDFEPWYSRANGCTRSTESTVRIDDPATSVLDVNCKAHELDNLYVVDTSFFPSIGAVNPALTAMANAIRVGEHLLSRMS